MDISVQNEVQIKYFEMSKTHLCVDINHSFLKHFWADILITEY